MYFNFELILFYAVLISGLVSLLDILFFAARRKRLAASSGPKKMPLIIEYSRSFFPVLLIVFLLRSFLFEPFRIPSGSLEPTLQIGDFILVNKFDYGLRLPVIHKKILDNKELKHGDIVVFRWPVNPSIDFIKRVVGLPGDKISYINKELYINGEKMPQTFLRMGTVQGEDGEEWQAQEKQEDLLGVKHSIFIDADKQDKDLHDIVVPPGMYFMVGDNRDDSGDSRYWGFVPDENIVGKAILVWMSWDSINMRPRLDRLGKMIH